MITCNRCGFADTVETSFCVKCGNPLSAKDERGPHAQHTEAPETPELPAWLQSLRADAAGVSEGDVPNMSDPEFIEEGPLPDWIHPQYTHADQPTPPQGALRPSAYAAPDTDETDFSARGISAHSLIDEQTLPPWMGGQSGSAQPPQSNIAGSSLIEQDALPNWLKSGQLQQDAYPPVQPSLQQHAPVPPAGTQFSANELIDPGALPSWMSPAAGTPFTASEEANVPASSLYDANSLPPWLREVEQGHVMGSPAMGPQSAQSLSSWQAASSPQAQSNPAVWQPAPPMPQPGNSNPGLQTWQPHPAAPGGNAPAGGVSAASFIDANALPAWLRTADAAGQPQQPGPIPNMNNQPPYMTAPRVEGARVPNRPRSETAAHTSSESAAQAFSSILGVASAAPNYPPQGQSTWAPPGMPAANQGAGGMAGSSQYGPPVQPYSAPMAPGYAGGSAAAYPHGTSQPSSMDVQQGTWQQGDPGMQTAQPKQARRGLFEAIRNWLFRQ